MSDFDKEAERERLREKYEAESEGREATQRMSELLLKGATMTNSHCGNCGDPIFRYDGTEFCPSCNADGQGTVDDATEQDVTTNADDTANAGNADASDATANVGNVNAGDVNADASDATANADATQSPRSDSPSKTGVGRSRTDPGQGRNAAPGRSPDGDATTRDSPAQNSARTGSQSPVAVDDDAVANVEATLQRFAAAANQTDDPERARECLDVVRDAAATLRSLHADGR